MTVNELIAMLQSAVVQGHGDKPVCQTDYNEEWALPCEVTGCRLESGEMLYGPGETKSFIALLSFPEES